MAVSAVNYAVGAVLSIGLLIGAAALGYEQHITWVAFMGGVVMGVLFYLYLLVLFRAYDFFGVGITTALIQMGVTLAAIFAWAVYGETIDGVQWAGLAMIPVALLLMRPRDVEDDCVEEAADGGGGVAIGVAVTRKKKAGWLAVTVVLLLTALVQTLFAIIHDAVPRFDTDYEHGFLAYTSTIFVFAGVLNVGHVLLFERKRYGIGTYSVGAFAGVANLGVCVCFLFAIDAIGSTIFLPTNSVAIIAVNIMIARMYWREPISRRQYVGLACSLLVIVLMLVSGVLGEGEGDEIVRLIEGASMRFFAV